MPRAPQPRLGYAWHLRKLMAGQGMFATTDLRPLLAERGIELSEAQIYRLVTGIPEQKLRVYRTRDAGQSWEPLTHGLPQEQSFESVLRDGLTADSHDPAGVYFGTRSGKLFASADAGANWTTIADALPPVCCVKAAVVGTA